MNKTIKLVRGILIIWVLIYLVFAFSLWDYNPANWSEFARVLAGGGFFMSALMTWLFMSMPDIEIDR